MKKNNFTQKIFLLMMVGILSSANFFALADTVLVSPTSGQSKSSNYILDYDTSPNKKSEAGQTKTVFVIQPAKSNDCVNCTDVATVSEIDVVHQNVPNTPTSTTVTVSTNISSRNIIYLVVGLMLILIMVILIIRFFKISDSLTQVRIEDKNKYD